MNITHDFGSAGVMVFRDTDYALIEYTLRNDPSVHWIICPQQWQLSGGPDVGSQRNFTFYNTLTGHRFCRVWTRDDAFTFLLWLNAR